MMEARAQIIEKALSLGARAVGIAAIDSKIVLVREFRSAAANGVNFMLCVVSASIVKVGRSSAGSLFCFWVRISGLKLS